MKTIFSDMLPSEIKFIEEVVYFNQLPLECQSVADICFGAKNVIRTNGLLNTVAYCCSCPKDVDYYKFIVSIINHSSSMKTADLLEGNITSRQLMTATATTLKALDFAQKRSGREPNVSRFFKP